MSVKTIEKTRVSRVQSATKVAPAPSISKPKKLGRAIPQFPKFKNIELADREEIESFTKSHPPYSDFNFYSLQSWNVGGQFRVSQLNKNLIIQFADYISGEPFFSFLGTRNVTETAELILEYCKKINIPATIKLLPEETAKLIAGQKLKGKEDKDNFDYVYDVNQLLALSGGEYETQRNLINRFHRRYQQVETFFYQELSEKNINVMLELFDTWERNKRATLPKERLALQRLLLGQVGNRDLFTVGVYVNNTLVAFALAEKMNHEYAIAHFAKADVNYAGVYAVLMQALASSLQKMDISYLNYEQDLGIEALRRSKAAFRPCLYLKKYIVEKS